MYALQKHCVQRELPNIQWARLTMVTLPSVKQFHVQHKRCWCALRLIRCHLTASVQERKEKKTHSNMPLLFWCGFFFFFGVRQKEIAAHRWRQHI